MRNCHKRGNKNICSTCKFNIRHTTPLGFDVIYIRDLISQKQLLNYQQIATQMSLKRRTEKNDNSDIDRMVQTPLSDTYGAIPNDEKKVDS